MSSDEKKDKDRKEYKKGYKSNIGTRSTVVQRSSGIGPAFAMGGMGGRGGSSYSMTMRQSMGPASYGSGTVSAATKSGIGAMQQGRANEKRELQGLNERFGGYIEKVRFLEAQNKCLLADLEKARKAKTFDFDKFKDMYEEELSAARKCIDDLSKAKADLDAQIAGLEDQVDSERADAADANRIADGLRTKVDQLINQIGNMEGEMKSYKLQNEQLKNDVKNLRDQNAKLQADIKRLRCDLDTETAAHISEAARAQTLEEQLAFEKEMYETQIAELKAMLDTDKTQEIQDTWKGELQNAIREMQCQYDEQLGQVRNELEMRCENQLREIRSGSTRDTVEAATVKEEVKKLKTKLGDLTKRCGDLEAENARLRASQKEYEDQINDLTRQLEESDRKSRETIAGLRMELEECLEQLQTLGDAKLTLELEIACYRSLLEGEECRVGLKNVVETMTDTRSAGGQQLANLIGQSSFTGESTGKMTVQRRSKGIVAFTEASQEGKFVILENTSSGVRKKAQDMYGWAIKRESKTGGPIQEFIFKDHYNLEPGCSVKIWSKGSAPSDREMQIEKSLKCDFFQWGTGSSEFSLHDNEGNEKASLSCKFSN